MKTLDQITELNQLYLLLDKTKYKISDVRKNKTSHSFRVELTHITEIKITMYCCFYLVLETYRFQLYIECGNKKIVASFDTSFYADNKKGDFKNNNFTEFKTKVPIIIDSIIDKDLTSLQAICNYYGLGEGKPNPLANPSFGIIWEMFDIYYSVFNMILKNYEISEILIKSALEYYKTKIKSVEQNIQLQLELNPNNKIDDSLANLKMFNDYKILSEKILSKIELKEFDSYQFLKEIEAIG